jgi:hypothetical protein
MKRVLLRCQVACLLAVSMLYAQSVVAQEQSSKVKECSKATLWGSFGYTSTGTLLDPMSRPLLRALSLRSVGRPSTGKVTLTQPQP